MPAAEVFVAFLRLGLTSFGGPIAHLAYFRTEFVDRRQWLGDARFTQLLALSQALPGPASSQLGFAIGMLRAGWPGAIAAFIGFTLPSALLLGALAGAAGGTEGWLASRAGTRLVHGLELTAVIVVAHAVLRMAATMATGRWHALLSAATAIVMLLVGHAGMRTAGPQLIVLAAAMAIGARWFRDASAARADAVPLRYGRRVGTGAILLFAVGLCAAVAWPAAGAPGIGGLAAAFWRAGSLVFGGGHVVLPLLEDALVGSGWMTAETFLAGYGAAQAIPGPMFALSAYLGAQVPTGAPAPVGAIVALVTLFLPGFLLLVFALPAWSRLQAMPRAGGALAGVNAAVVGLLAAAWYDPVMTSGIRATADAVVAVIGLALLLRAPRTVPWIAVGCVGASFALG